MPKVVRRGLHLCRSTSRFLRSRADPGDITRDLLGSGPRLIDISSDLLRRRPLFFHRGRNRCGNIVDLFDHGADLRNRRNGLLRLRLNARYLRCDFLGGVAGLGSK